MYVRVLDDLICRPVAGSPGVLVSTRVDRTISQKAFCRRNPRASDEKGLPRASHTRHNTTTASHIIIDSIYYLTNILRSGVIKIRSAHIICFHKHKKNTNLPQTSPVVLPGIVLLCFTKKKRFHSRQIPPLLRLLPSFHTTPADETPKSRKIKNKNTHEKNKSGVRLQLLHVPHHHHERHKTINQFKDKSFTPRIHGRHWD